MGPRPLEVMVGGQTLLRTFSVAEEGILLWASLGEKAPVEPEPLSQLSSQAVCKEWFKGGLT
jgi:hypothetical protein